MVPPERPAALARFIDGYLMLSGALKVSEPSLHSHISNMVQLNNKFSNF
jgi:hypothetical protein